MIRLERDEQFYIETADGRVFHVKGVTFKNNKSNFNHHQIEYHGDIIDPISGENENIVIMIVDTEENMITDDNDC